jgi:flagellar protein FliJ
MANKAADLDTLIRLREWAVDERRRELGALIAREDQLIAYGRQLEMQLVREGDIVKSNSQMLGFMFGPFAEDHKKRRERLAVTLAAVRKEVEAARERLAQAFRERKVMEEVQASRAERERVEAARLEQVELDEIAATQHRMHGE